MTKAEIKKKALDLLARREHSRQELREKLLRREFNISEIEEVLEKLESENYLNDSRFAEEWIRSRKKNKPRGKNLIKAELLDKGVEREIVEARLAENISRSEERKMARELAEKWLRKKSSQDYETREKKYKLTGYLSRKGFSREISRNLVEELIAE